MPYFAYVLAIGTRKDKGALSDNDELTYKPTLLDVSNFSGLTKSKFVV
jgi:hypothetical protein